MKRKKQNLASFFNKMLMLRHQILFSSWKEYQFAFLSMQHLDFLVYPKHLIRYKDLDRPSRRGLAYVGS
jgi:hypothetical protein